MAQDGKIRYVGSRIDFLERCRRRYFNEKMSDIGLKPHQFTMLLFILHDEGCTQEDLSRKMAVDKTRIARSCIELDEGGYIERRRDTEDRRKHHLFLTPKGSALIPGIRRVMAEWDAVITAGLDEEKVAMLMEVTDILLENVRRYEEESGS